MTRRRGVRTRCLETVAALRRVVQCCSRPLVPLPGLSTRPTETGTGNVEDRLIETDDV
jgi:hypothetical protein